MIATRTFKDSEGQVTQHMVNPYDGEFTLCGLAFDCSMEYEGIEMIDNEKKKINCLTCVIIIRGCKEVRASKLEKESNLIIP